MIILELTSRVMCNNGIIWNIDQLGGIFLNILNPTSIPGQGRPDSKIHLTLLKNMWSESQWLSQTSIRLEPLCLQRDRLPLRVLPATTIMSDSRLFDMVPTSSIHHRIIYQSVWFHNGPSQFYIQDFGTNVHDGLPPEIFLISHKVIQKCKKTLPQCRWCICKSFSVIYKI